MRELSKLQKGIWKVQTDQKTQRKGQTESKQIKTYTVPPFAMKNIMLHEILFETLSTYAIDGRSDARKAFYNT